MNGYRCPRCSHTEIHGTHRTFGARTIIEYFCPSCSLMETADSDQPDYAETIARWRIPDEQPQPS